MKKSIYIINDYLKNRTAAGNQPTRLRCALRRMALLSLLAITSIGIKAADYVFIYDNGYLAVDDNGAIIYTADFTPQCVWTCVSNTANLTPATLSNNSDNTLYWLTTLDANGTRRWLQGSTTNGTAISTSISSGTAYWRTDNDNYLRYRNSNTTYYVYYRDDVWRTSSSNRGDRNGVNAYRSGNNNGTDYRSTTTAITVEQGSTDDTTPPTISAALNSVNTGIQLSHTNVYGTYLKYKKTKIGTTTYYWLDGASTAYDEVESLSSDVDWSKASYEWSISSGGNYATITSDGVLTSKGVATSQQEVTVKLTTTYSDIGYSDEGPTFNIYIQDHAATPVTAGIGDDNVINTLGRSITLRGYISDSYTPAYTVYEYPNGNNGTNHHTLYNGRDYGYQTPAIYSGNENLVYSWTLTGEGASYASLDTTTPTQPVLTYNTDAGHDVTATLNLTITHPDFPEFNVTAEPYDVTLYSTNPSAPTFSRSGDQVTLSTSSPEGSIYYTTDGSNPKDGNNPNASTSAIQFNGPINLTTSPTTIKAFTIRWNYASEVVQEIFKLKLASPELAITNGTVTIANSASNPSDATIYYSIDGSDPTTAYTAPLTVGNGTIVKAVMKKDGWDDSDPAQIKYIIQTEISGTTLIINDLEDHNWTYYSSKPDDKYPDQLRSPDPRNVRITYRGGSVNNASAVAVSATEPVNEFVYYKTIEKKAWGQSEGRWLTGDYAYKVIPNPFSKRPRTNGTTGTNGFYGFAGWKIVSGAGETKGSGYIANHKDGDVLDLEEKINFINLPAGNDGNGAVVFEATWTAASVVTTTANITGNLTGMDGANYETNFIVYTDNGTHTVSGLTTGATISNNYPNGEHAGSATISSFTTSSAAAKLEYIKIGDGNTPIHPTSPSVASSTYTGTGTFQAQSGELIVGRGCTGTVRKINSGGGGGQYKFRIESGKYNFMYAMESGHTHSNANPNYGRIVLGCDYDRAADDGIEGNGTGDNTKLRIVNYCSLDGGGAAGSNASELMDITVKSGYYGFSANYGLNNGTSGAVDGYGLGIGGNTDNFSGTFTTTGPTGATITYNYAKPTTNTAPYQWEKLLSFYVGPTRGAGKGGVNRMLVEGGEFNSINGGGTNPGNVNTIGFYYRMKGGWVKGAVYGTASISNSEGSRSLVFTGGEVNGWVAGGCNGTDFSAGDGKNEGTCYIYAGGNTEFRSHDGQGTYNNAYGLVFNVPGGQIFGAGRGMAPGTANNVKFCGSTTTAYVTVADETFVEQNVYGGGYNGVSQNSHVYITGGTVGKKVFGGTARAVSTDGTWRCIDTDIRMYGGTVKGGIYGGHDETGVQFGDANVAIYGGTVGDEAAITDASKRAFVHGGGYGRLTVTQGDVNVTVGDAQPGSTIYGDVYGGSALGQTNATADFSITNYNTNPLTVNVANVASNANKSTKVTLNAGTIYGSLYGGALGQKNGVNGATSDIASNVYGPVSVEVYGGSVVKTDGNPGGVFGANNLNGAPQSSVKVDIFSTDAAPGEGSYAVNAVYGGGNLADYIYNNYPTVTVHNGGADNSIGYVYGGGNAASVQQTQVKVYGGNKIGNVFGGGNGTDGAAPVTNNSNVDIYGGTILNVFGGSNTNGLIGGNITVNVIEGAESGYDLSPVNITNVYGGGNNAPYVANVTPNYPLVNINNGSVTGSVFGGGKGELAVVTGTPQVNVDDSAAGRSVTIGQNVFGGGDAAQVTGSTDVNIIHGTVNGSVFGGGNEAGVTVSGVVDMTGGDVKRGVYGGSNSEGTVGSTTVTLTGGTVGTDTDHANVHGGGYGQQTQVSGNVTVNMGTSSASGSAYVYGDVYGGSALGTVNTDTGNSTQVNLYGGTIEGDAYGGGLGQKNGFYGATSDIAALVKGNVTVTLNGTKFVQNTVKDDENNDVPVSGRVFGCNNLNGTPKGTVLVYVASTSPLSGGHTEGSYEVQAVYGGGNLAPYDPADAEYDGQYITGSHNNVDKPVQVVIDGCGEASIEYVYGGGNAASVPATDVLVLGSYEIGNVFGGGNGKDKFTDGTIWNANDGADVGVKDASHDASGKATGGTTYGTGKALATILGGTIHSVFGASNTKGDIMTSAEVVLGDENLETCHFELDEVYGGGNEAYMTGVASIDMECIEGLENIYGGSKKADINGDVVLNITGGSFGKVFGGNNISGTIYGTITVNIEEKGCLPIRIGELYGGGNQAPYSVENLPAARKDALGDNYKNYPQVNVISATEIGTIYGGGLGSTAVITGNPHVNINMEAGKVDGTYKYVAGKSPAGYAEYATGGTEKALTLGTIGTVFGGGNAAQVNGSTYVNIGDKTFVDEDNNPVTINRGDANITGSVFGGGNNAIVTGGSNVIIGKPE